MNASVETSAYLREGCHRPATNTEAHWLADPWTLPAEGESRVVAINNLSSNRLHLHRINGRFWLEGTAPLSFWPSTFGVRGEA